MPAINFICPDGTQVPIEQCIAECPKPEACIAKTVRNSLASGVKNRGLKQFSVTELIRGTMESYLKLKTDYAIDPMSLIASTFGTAVHRVQEISGQKLDNIQTELRLNNDIATGQIDAYGPLFSPDEYAICDYKVTTSYTAAKRLGIGSHDEIVPTGEVYKTGAKKGQPKFKTVKIWHEDGRKDLWEWTLQQNFYRMLLEEHGYRVDAMYIQMLIRDYSTGMATQRHIYKPMYKIKLNKISNHWLRLYFQIKRDRLAKALESDNLPTPCSGRETWNGVKCSSFCDINFICPIGQAYLNSKLAESENTNPQTV